MSGDNRDAAPRNVLPDLIIPVLAFAFTVYYLTTITEVPWIAQASAVFVGTLLFVAIAAYAIRTVARLRAGSERLGFDALFTDLPVQVKRLALLGLTIVYMLLITRLGFTLATFLFLFSGILLLSTVANWRRAALVAACCSVTGYVVFIYFFETRFPKGWFELAVESLVRHGS
ncbi:MAG: tripartite tricarboxylate transporter TctB family protein [Burkholderiales bacterium]|nr:MAG: tripartite tricarboxylate transporter TctB family protein [Burkholderiales bacterium]